MKDESNILDIRPTFGIRMYTTVEGNIVITNYPEFGQDSADSVVMSPVEARALLAKLPDAIALAEEDPNTEEVEL